MKNSLYLKLKKPLPNLSKNKLNDEHEISLDENNYLEIANEILNYSIEDEEVIGDIELNYKGLNDNNYLYDNNQDNIKIEEIYKNNTLMADIIFHSFVGIDNLRVNCYFNCGIQILLHSNKFMLDIIIDINNNILNKNNISSSFIDLCKSIIEKYLAYNDISINDLTYDEIYKFQNYNFLDKEKRISVSPKKLLNIFCKMHPIYKDSQEDVVEFLRVLLNELSFENNYNSNGKYKELSFEGKSKSISSKEYHNNYIKKENSAVIKNYYFQMINIYIYSC